MEEQGMPEDTAECEHGEPVKWNPYNGVVQCHRCGVTFAPMEAGVQRCQFCGKPGDIQSQAMGEGRTIRLCETCRGHIEAGRATERP